MLIAFGVGLGVDQVFSRRTLPTVPVTENLQPVPLATVFEPTKEPPLPPPPPVAIETPNTVLDFDPEKFYPGGGYSIVGQVPKKFRQFRFFTLEFSEPVAGLSGYLYIATGPKESFDYQKAVFGLVTKKRMFWATPTMPDGFEYRFEGEFLLVDFDSVANTKTPVLKGTLTKTRNGRRVAESVVSFSLEYDRC
jgi:hypothetical protein